jgi:hypothetical protein
MKHKNFIYSSAKSIFELQINYPVHEIKKDNIIRKYPDAKKWLIIHSGPFEEVMVLLENAKETALINNESPLFILISQVDEIRNEGLLCLAECPAHGYFRYADRLFTACGFNIMNQTKPFREKQMFYPFVRKYDDQFWRAEQAKKRGNH